MNLITRSDFDGLASAVLLKKIGVIDSYTFVHPKDLQDGKVPVTKNDVLTNVPFVKGCGLWFDHHTSEQERRAYTGKFEGSSWPAPSAARVIYDYYGGQEKFGAFFDPMMEAVDKIDSAMLLKEEILDPKGWVLLGFIMDPRTGLGRFRNFTISNLQLMEKMIDWCETMTIEEILALPDVVERVELYLEQAELFKKMITERSKVVREIVITDLRGIDEIYAGNRFLIYSMYPKCNISVWIVSGRGGKGCSCAVGHSVLNRTCKLNVGSLMLKYNGGGHMQVGTCQFSDEEMESQVPQLIEEIISLN